MPSSDSHPRVTLPRALEGLYKGEVPWFVVPAGGVPSMGLAGVSAPILCPVYSGSFRPLHAAHRAIHRQVMRMRGSCCFEVSIRNFEKGLHDPLEMQRVIEQFEGWATVWVTAAMTFSEKAGMLPPSPTFVCGADVFMRVIEHPEKPDALFLVFNRAIVSGEPGVPEWMPLSERIGSREVGVRFQEVPFMRMDVSSSMVRRDFNDAGRR